MFPFGDRRTILGEDSSPSYTKIVILPSSPQPTREDADASLPLSCAGRSILDANVSLSCAVLAIARTKTPTTVMRKRLIIARATRVWTNGPQQRKPRLWLSLALE